MNPIPRRHIEDMVYEKLLENIKTGVWQNGERLPSETELSLALQVSRASVRGALQRLRALGLIEVIHGKGSYVSLQKETYNFDRFSQSVNLTEKEFFDLTEFRDSVEKCAIRLVAEKGGQANLSQVENAYLSMRRAAENNDPDEYSKQDCRFHLSLLAATQNELFIQLAKIFQENYYHYFRELNKFLFECNDGDVKALFNPNNPSDAHTMIYEYLCKGNTACAQGVMDMILFNNKQRFMKYLRQKEQKTREGEGKDV